MQGSPQDRVHVPVLTMAQAKAACREVRYVGHIGQKHVGPERRGASQTPRAGVCKADAEETLTMMRRRAPTNARIPSPHWWRDAV